MTMKQKEFAPFMGTKYRMTPVESKVSAIGPTILAVERMKRRRSEKMDLVGSVQPGWERATTPEIVEQLLKDGEPDA